MAVRVQRLYEGSALLVGDLVTEAWKTIRPVGLSKNGKGTDLSWDADFRRGSV